MQNYISEIQKTITKLNALIKLSAVDNMPVKISVYCRNIGNVEFGLLECQALGNENNEPAQKNNLLLYHQ